MPSLQSDATRPGRFCVSPEFHKEQVATCSGGSWRCASSLVCTPTACGIVCITATVPDARFSMKWLCSVFAMGGVQACAAAPMVSAGSGHGCAVLGSGVAQCWVPMDKAY